MKRLSVMHVCKVYFPIKGGVQIVAERICRGLSARFKNTILTTARVRGAVVERDEATLVTARSWGDILSLPIAPSLVTSIWRYARKVDLLILHYPFPLADLAIALARGSLPPIIVYWHSDIVSQTLTRRLIEPFTRRMLERSSAIVASSPNLIKYSPILSEYKNKCRVVPFGYQPDNPDLATCDEGYYLCIGRHVPYKGFGYMIRALQYCTVRVDIVGNGPLLKQHKLLAQRLGVSDRVSFSTDVDDNALNDKIARCRALVLPSTMNSEAFALVQVEAMAYGKPVLNTDLKSGVPWVARNEKEGLTVKPKDEKSLANALDRLEKDQELRARLGKAAKQRWRDVFSLASFLDTTDDLYRECVASGVDNRDS